MTSVKVFDPAMCCSTGVCGPAVDPALGLFAADLDWLAGTGVSVERFNLAQQPEAFVAHPEVTEALRAHGEAALPLILVDGRKVMEGVYPSRDQLARLTSAAPPPGAPEPANVPAISELGCGCSPGGCS